MIIPLISLAYDSWTVHGDFTEWTDWSDCSSFCGSGVRKRYDFL